MGIWRRRKERRAAHTQKDRETVREREMDRDWNRNFLLCKIKRHVFIYIYIYYVLLLCFSLAGRNKIKFLNSHFVLVLLSSFHECRRFQVIWLFYHFFFIHLYFIIFITELYAIKIFIVDNINMKKYKIVILVLSALAWTVVIIIVHWVRFVQLLKHDAFASRV